MSYFVLYFKGHEFCVFLLNFVRIFVFSFTLLYNWKVFSTNKKIFTVMITHIFLDHFSFTSKKSTLKLFFTFHTIFTFSQLLHKFSIWHLIIATTLLTLNFTFFSITESSSLLLTRLTVSFRIYYNFFLVFVIAKVCKLQMSIFIPAKVFWMT